ncbi:hypothetical protein A2V68_01245 [candidate division Kazan bacterium RBG_13_50_9]|uniref:DUF218 domain-containing protein n=1 Tax=candidate division Kazan bacterium RBG_13_50_9 TaxID=1798535 RepID=A0A1F4NST9_UNCK3|nr:MAG: hypothetical protein A2V68_01245 [candidate division Kazan bacterium RBG_13_50_9]
MSPTFNNLELPDPVAQVPKFIEYLVGWEFVAVCADDGGLPPAILQGVEKVVVLSAPGEGSALESRLRIRVADKLMGDLMAGGVNTDVPKLILNGETEQLPGMYDAALECVIGSERSCWECNDCGPRGVGNTKTQFTTMVSGGILEGISRIIVVTSWYHVPRVARTASRYLPPELNFQVVGVPSLHLHPHIKERLLMIAGEIRRILQYAPGDIDFYPRSLLAIPGLTELLAERR